MSPCKSDRTSRIRDGDPSVPPRFVADAMLGRLARWLRLLGFDVAYDPKNDDRTVARLAVLENRIVLTRDRQLLARRLVRESAGGLLVDADDLADQLSIVFGELGLKPDPKLMLSRCSSCNGELERVERESLCGRVPPYVQRTASRFCRCVSCGKFYWDGTHRGMIGSRLERLLEGDFE